MKKIMIIIAIISVIMMGTTATATWSQKWAFDPASPNYESYWVDYVPHITDRIWYRSEIMPLAADVINNGQGSADKPILEVFIAAGRSHAETDCPTCGVSGSSVANVHIDGSITCLNGETGEMIWRFEDPRIYVQSKMELGDVDGDGDLEMFVNCFHGYFLLDAKTGEEIWGGTRTVRTDKFSVIVKDNRETKDGIPNPDYGEVFIYQPMGEGAISKRDKDGNIVAEGVYSNGPCFGGASAADMNNDGIPEILEHTYTPGSHYCYDLDLNLIWRDSSGGGGGNPPVIIDVNNDGWLDVVKTIGASSSSVNLGVLDGKESWENGVGTYMSGKTSTGTGYSGHNAPAVYDLDGDGNLEAFLSWGNSNPCGAWDLGTWSQDTKFDDLAHQSHAATIGNVYGDENLELLGDFAYNRVFDGQGNQVGSTSGQGSNGKSPHLIADIDGDGLNEVVTSGSNILTTPNPFGTSTVWSWGWNICWDTEATALNPYQAVYSQLYSPRRLSSELPALEPLWMGGTVTPPPEDKKCWGCENENPSYAMFPYDTDCATTAFPYEEQQDCTKPLPEICWECIDGEAVSTEHPPGTYCEGLGLSDTKPVCIPDLPGFELPLMVLGLIGLMFYFKRRR